MKKSILLLVGVLLLCSCKEEQLPPEITLFDGQTEITTDTIDVDFNSTKEISAQTTSKNEWASVLGHQVYTLQKNDEEVDTLHKSPIFRIKVTGSKIEIGVLTLQFTDSLCQSGDNFKFTTTYPNWATPITKSVVMHVK